MKSDQLRARVKALVGRDPNEAAEIIRGEMMSRAGRAFAKPEPLTASEWTKLIAEAKENSDLTALLHSAMCDFPSPPRCRAIAAVAFSRHDYDIVIEAGRADGDVAQLGNVIQVAKDYKINLMGVVRKTKK